MLWNRGWWIFEMKGKQSGTKVGTGSKGIWEDLGECFPMPPFETLRSQIFSPEIWAFGRPLWKLSRHTLATTNMTTGHNRRYIPPSFLLVGAIFYQDRPPQYYETVKILNATVLWSLKVWFFTTSQTTSTTWIGDNFASGIETTETISQ